MLGVAEMLRFPVGKDEEYGSQNQYNNWKVAEKQCRLGSRWFQFSCNPHWIHWIMKHIPSWSKSHNGDVMSWPLGDIIHCKELCRRSRRILTEHLAQAKLLLFDSLVTNPVIVAMKIALVISFFMAIHALRDMKDEMPKQISTYSKEIPIPPHRGSYMNVGYLVFLRDVLLSTIFSS